VGAAFIMTASQANAKGGILHFTCEPGFDSVSGTKSSNVLSSTVERLSREGDDIWVINYRLANGTVVSRNDQYDVTRDSSLPRGRHGWTGRLRSNPGLEMDGEVAKGGVNGYVYTERLWDNAHDHKLIMRTVAMCTRVTDLATLTPYLEPTPTPDTPPPTVGPTLGSDSVPIYPGSGGRAALVDLLVGSLPVRMLIDTGATSMTVTQSIASILVQNGEATWLDPTTVSLADGSVTQMRQLTIRNVTIGRHTVNNIVAGVVSDSSDMLLGFPVLNRVGRFTIDTNSRRLIFG
jgi:clan AA aspartic protease (TIGR02281 family)